MNTNDTKETTIVTQTSQESVQPTVRLVQSEPTIKKTKIVTEPAVTSLHDQQVHETKKTIFRTYQVIWYITSFLEILLGFRFLLKILGANPFSGFANMIYTVTTPFVAPFSGILRTDISANSVFEWSTVFAGVVYFLIAWGLIYLLQLVKPVTPEEVSYKLDAV